MNEVYYRDMLPGDEQHMSRMINCVFQEFVASDFSEEGVKIFLDFVQPEEMRKRRESGNIFILAVIETVIGLIEVRDKNHIALFFVEKSFHQNGIGAKLLEIASEKVKECYPGTSELSVHSSLFAVPIYERLGFKAIDIVQISNGFKYVPMKMIFG